MSCLDYLIELVLSLNLFIWLNPRNSLEVDRCQDVLVEHAADTIPIWMIRAIQSDPSEAVLTPAGAPSVLDGDILPWSVWNGSVNAISHSQHSMTGHICRAELGIDDAAGIVFKRYVLGSDGHVDRADGECALESGGTPGLDPKMLSDLKSVSYLISCQAGVSSADVVELASEPVPHLGGGRSRSARLSAVQASASVWVLGGFVDVVPLEMIKYFRAYSTIAGVTDHAFLRTVFDTV